MLFLRYTTPNPMIPTRPTDRFPSEAPEGVSYEGHALHKCYDDLKMYSILKHFHIVPPLCLKDFSLGYIGFKECVYGSSDRLTKLQHLQEKH
ncbi:hypothetical protein E2C01_092872 [Portunus trituberculatus]|uniref:Uncharacterized protein n=1 Tax=Portunus trituberculatus TaxID=210409 RepID=A0A5B7JNA8_PORTR|nr:hypothetical protein [Portunus trituberculatus]